MIGVFSIACGIIYHGVAFYLGDLIDTD